MFETILEAFAFIIADLFPRFLKILGACIKWIFHLGRRKFSQIMEEDWNIIIGLLFLLTVILYIISFSFVDGLLHSE